MHFNVSQIPEACLRSGVEVGDVYAAKGGCGSTKMWVVAAVNKSTAHALGVDSQGQVVSTTSYGIHVFERRELIGRCEEMSRQLTVERYKP